MMKTFYKTNGTGMMGNLNIRTLKRMSSVFNTLFFITLFLAVIAFYASLIAGFIISFLAVVLVELGATCDDNAERKLSQESEIEPLVKG